MSNGNHAGELKRAWVFGLALIAGGCNLDVFGGNDGRVRVVLHPDAASAIANVVADSTGVLRDDDDDDGNKHRGGWWFQTANVTLSSILLRTEDGELVSLDAELPITVDVVEIDGGKQVQLPDGILDAASYDQVVLVISSVQMVAHDGTIITIDPPGGGWTAIVPVCPFEVLEGETTTLGIALNVRRSFLQLGSWWSFAPRFRSMDACEG